MENSENINQSAKQAKCTDTIWMVVYVVCWFVIVALSICWIYFRFPHPTINVTDLLGNTCGVGSNQRNPNLPLSGINMIDKPYKHYYDSDEPGHSISNCVKECPLRDLSTIDDLVRYFEEFQINYCQYDLNISRLARDTSETTYFDPTVSCPKLPVYRSIPILGRCIPTGKNAPIQQTKKLLASIRFWEVAQQMFNDLFNYFKTAKSLSICGTLIVPFILIFLLYLFGTIVSRFICVFGILVFVGVTIGLWYIQQNTPDIDQRFLYRVMLLNYEDTIRGIAIVVTCITGVMLFYLCYRWKELKWMGDLYKVTGRCLLELENWTILWSLVSLMLIMICIIVVCFLVASTSQLACWISIPVLVLVVQSTTSFLRLVTAVNVTSWWYNGTTLSVTKVAKYHLGSAVKGWFFITLCKIPRIILLMIASILDGQSIRNKRCFRYSSNAYVMIARNKINFNEAANSAWNSLGDYQLRVAHVSGISGFVLFLGKVAVAGLCGLICMPFSEGNPILVIVPSIVAFIFAHIILSLFEMVGDTLLVCVCNSIREKDDCGRFKEYSLAAIFNPEAVNEISMQERQVAHSSEA